jgi:hypothetical protein
MADNSPTFYDPQTAASPGEKSAGAVLGAQPPADVTDAAAERPRGRPPKNADAVAVSAGVSADTSLDPKDGESLDEAIARIRAIRKPFGGAMSQKLALPERIGYHRHWFNDVAGRIDEAKASGWSHLKNPRDGAPLKRAVGTGRDNNVLYAYAMELPEVFWQEEMNARHEVAKQKIDGIKAKPFRAQAGQAQAADQGKFYNPVEESGAGPLQVVKG